MHGQARADLADVHLETLCGGQHGKRTRSLGKSPVDAGRLFLEHTFDEYFERWRLQPGPSSR
jgi:hypothetical protein